MESQVDSVTPCTCNASMDNIGSDSVTLLLSFFWLIVGWTLQLISTVTYSIKMVVFVANGLFLAVRWTISWLQRGLARQKQFVFGLNNDTLKEWLLQEITISLIINKLIALTQRMEFSRRQIKEMMENLHWCCFRVANMVKQTHAHNDQLVGIYTFNIFLFKAPEIVLFIQSILTRLTGNLGTLWSWQ